MQQSFCSNMNFLFIRSRLTLLQTQTSRGYVIRTVSGVDLYLSRPNVVSIRTKQYLSLPQQPLQHVPSNVRQNVFLWFLVTLRLVSRIQTPRSSDPPVSPISLHLPNQPVSTQVSLKGIVNRRRLQKEVYGRVSVTDERLCYKHWDLFYKLENRGMKRIQCNILKNLLLITQ